MFILHGFYEAKCVPAPFLYHEISVYVSYAHGFYESKVRSPVSGPKEVTLFLHADEAKHQGMYLYRIYIPTVRPINIDTSSVDTRKVEKMNLEAVATSAKSQHPVVTLGRCACC